jgi:hypothetical protein
MMIRWQQAKTIEFLLLIFAMRNPIHPYFAGTRVEYAPNPITWNSPPLHNCKIFPQEEKLEWQQ